MDEERYARLIRLEGVGKENFQRIRKSRVVLVGCGALGCLYAVSLIRSGLGYLRLIDRDIVEDHNLSAQILYDQDDILKLKPKAVAAREHLESLGLGFHIEAHARELQAGNAEELLGGVDLIIDSTDNFETRFLINDTAVKLGVPWVYTGVVGFRGSCLAIVPGKSACLRCLMDGPLDPGEGSTCETSGVWLSAAQAISAVGMTEALRLLIGETPLWGLCELDLKTGNWRIVRPRRKSDCPVCVMGDYSYLSGDEMLGVAKLCGRDTVHLSPAHRRHLDLRSLAKSLPDGLSVQVSEGLLHWRSSEAEIYLFSDGRALVKGVTDPGRAKAIFSRYIAF